MSTKIANTAIDSISSNNNKIEDVDMTGGTNGSSSNNGGAFVPVPVIEGGKKSVGGVNVDADFDLFHEAAEYIDEEEIGEEKGGEAKLQQGEERKKEKKGQYVTPQDFELLKVIGMGSFGKVLQCRAKNKKEVVAMKVISKRLLRKKLSYVENIHAERTILTKLSSHPFIVTMHCSFQTRDKLFIVMDYCAGGELFMWLGKSGVFLEKTASFYVAEVILALEHLHSHNVLHRDLKPENILLNTDGHLRLTDFGLAKELVQTDDDKTLTVCGTQEYMAPEMIARVGYGKAADFWSLGCIAYEMLSGNPPFSSTKKGGAKELFQKIMVERVKMPKHSTSNAHKLIKGLLNRNVTMRLGSTKSTMFQVGGITQLKQLDFFTNYWDWTKLENLQHEPPQQFHVDHDEDYRHFHSEFTEMSVPRSVIEMSADNAKYKPRHCNSQTFRGFSYIQPDFEIPDRLQDQEHYYWGNTEEDGESLSDCASSAFQDNENNTDATTINCNDNEEETPKKKKKKKKKKKQPPAITDDNNNDNNKTKDPSAADDTILDSKLKIENLTLQSISKSASTTNEINHINKQPFHKVCPSTATKTIKTNNDDDNKNKKNPWNRSVGMTLKQVESQQPPQNMVAVSLSTTVGVGRTTASNNNDNRRTNKKQQWETVSTKSSKNQNGHNSAIPIAVPHKPSLSSWNVVTNNTTTKKKPSPTWNNNNNNNKQGGQAHPITSTPTKNSYESNTTATTTTTHPTTSTSTQNSYESNITATTSDWRTHSMRPSKEPSWPSLSVPTTKITTRLAKPKDTASQAKSPIPRGAWASKVLKASSTSSNQPKINKSGCKS